MKQLFPLLALTFLFSLQSSFASDKEYFGYLKSGDGFCSIKLEKQNEYLYQLVFHSNEMSVRAVNIELKGGQFDSFTESFEREGNYYDQVYFGYPLAPRMYEITMKNLGKGQYSIKKTTVVFGQAVLSKKDVCITRFN